MELAKVTSKGQITIPKTIRDLLNIKEGSKILFIEKDNEIDGEAQRLNLKTEEDVVKLVKKFRKERKK